MAEISGNRQCSPDQIPNSLPGYPQGKPFAELLRWHLQTNGTRSTGSPGKLGKLWQLSKFAEAVGSDDRTVRNWIARKNNNAPHDIEKICDALFGENTEYDEWRRELRSSALLLQKNNRNKPAKKSSNLREGYLLNIPPRVSGFIARDSELSWLKRNLLLPNDFHSRRLAIVHSFGGVGKTALSIEFAHTNSGSFSRIYWCASETRDALLSSLANLAESLELSLVDGQDKLLTAQQVLQKISAADCRYLLIYDNVDSPKTLAGLLPQRSASILITTQFSDWIDIGPSLFLKVFTERRAATLLNKLANRADRAGSTQLAVTLGGLPLALNHAAITCRRCNMSFADYAEKAEEYIRVSPQAADNERHVFATLELMMKNHVVSNHAIELLYFLSFCGSEGIPAELFADYYPNSSQKLKALLVLQELSLVTLQRRENSYELVFVHRLVQSVARLKAMEAGVYKDTLEKICTKLGSMIPDSLLDEKLPSQLSNYLIPHVIAINQRHFDELKTLKSCPMFLYSMSVFLSASGLYDLGEILLSNCRRICEQNVISIDTYDVLEGNWLKFMDDQHHRKFINSEKHEEHRAIYDRYQAVVFLSAKNQTRKIKALGEEVSDHETLKLYCIGLSVFLLIEDPNSFYACETLCCTGLMLNRLGYGNAATLAFMAANDIYPIQSKLSDFIKKDYSWHVLIALVQNDYEKRQMVALRIKYLMNLPSTDCLKLAEAIDNLASINEKTNGAFSGFVVRKWAYRVLAERLGANDLDTLDALWKVGLNMLRAGKIKWGNQVFNLAVSKLCTALGPNNYRIRAANYKYENNYPSW